MPEKGFSIKDLLYPKPRRYEDNCPKHTFRVNSYKAKVEAERILKALGLDSLPIPLEPICEYVGAYVVLIETIPENPKAVGRFLGDGSVYGSIKIPRMAT